MKRWKIEYYETESGKIPVKRFIDSLAQNSQAKIYNTFELLIEFDIKLGRPHTKKVINTKLWELRVLGQKSLRFFYIAQTGKKFLLLHGFTKKSQKTPKKEIKTALKRLKEYQSKHNRT